MKATIAFLLVFFFCIIFDGIMMGEGAIASTRLTADLTATGTTVTVASTEGFLRSSYITMGNERVRYTNTTATTFVVPVTNGRGWDGTLAVPHSERAMVYSPASVAINNLMGFNVASTGTTVGAWEVIGFGYNFFTVTVPKMLSWNYSFLMTFPILMYFRIVFIIITAAYVVYMAIQFVNTLFGIFRR